MFQDTALRLLQPAKASYHIEVLFQMIAVFEASHPQKNVANLEAGEVIAYFNPKTYTAWYHRVQRVETIYAEEDTTHRWPLSMIVCDDANLLATDCNGKPAQVRIKPRDARF